MAIMAWMPARSARREAQRSSVGMSLAEPCRQHWSYHHEPLEQDPCRRPGRRRRDDLANARAGRRWRRTTALLCVQGQVDVGVGVALVDQHGCGLWRQPFFSPGPYRAGAAARSPARRRRRSRWRGFAAGAPIGHDAAGPSCRGTALPQRTARAGAAGPVAPGGGGRERAALGPVGRLAHPAPERQVCGRQVLQQLRYRIGAVLLRVQQGIGRPAWSRKSGALRSSGPSGWSGGRARRLAASSRISAAVLPMPSRRRSSCNRYTPARP